MSVVGRRPGARARRVQGTADTQLRGPGRAWRMQAPAGDPGTEVTGRLRGYAVDSGGPGRPRMWPLFHRQQKARDDVSSPRDPQGPPTTNVGTGQCRALWVMKQPLARMQKTGPG